MKTSAMFKMMALAAMMTVSTSTYANNDKRHDVNNDRNGYELTINQKQDKNHNSGRTAQFNDKYYQSGRGHQVEVQQGRGHKEVKPNNHKSNVGVAKNNTATGVATGVAIGVAVTALVTALMQ